MKEEEYRLTQKRVVEEARRDKWRIKAEAKIIDCAAGVASRVYNSGVLLRIIPERVFIGVGEFVIRRESNLLERVRALNRAERYLGVPPQEKVFPKDIPSK